MDAAGNLQLGIILLQGLGDAAQGFQRLSPTELLDVVVHELGHLVAVVFLELLHALRAAARPVVAGAAGDGGVALGIGIVRLIPEEAVHLRLPGKLQAQALEVVPEGIGIEAGSVQHFAGVGADLTVMDVVLQEQGNLLAAKILADAPGVRDDPQAHFVRLLHDGVDVGEPEVHIELSDGKQNGVHAMVDHFPEVLLSVLDIIKTVITDGSMFDRHVYSSSLFSSFIIPAIFSEFSPGR